MTREERIAAIVEAIASQPHAWMLAPKARRQIAEVAIDAADATREPDEAICKTWGIIYLTPLAV